MNRDLVFTKDGSMTVCIGGTKMLYHSIHGAVAESTHVYIQAGLQYKRMQIDARNPIRILEVGFGTGLNALLTLIETEETDQIVHYTALEPFPLLMNEVKSLNYCEFLGRTDLVSSFRRMHASDWG